MNYVILDLEWNQPFPRKKIIRIPFELYGEIIQIGAVKVTEDFSQIDTFNVIIKPDFYTKMDKAVTELTEISQEDIDGGIPFGEAIVQFRQWLDEDRVILTWGPDDMDMIRDNLEFREMDAGWLPDDVDAQCIFDDFVTQEDRQFALGHAMFIMDLKPLRCHDALNDALNTADVLKAMDRNDEIKEYVEEWINEQ